MPLNYDALTALTRERYIPEMVDNIFKSNPLLTRLKKVKKTFDGGYKIIEPLVYGEISGIKSYSMYDKLEYDTNIPVSAAEFVPKNVVAPIIISKEEELLNSGESQVLSMLKAKVDIVQESLKKQLTSMLYLDGSGNSGKDLTGLAAAIADSGTYGGIDRGTYNWWKAKIASNSGTPGTPADLAIGNMIRMFLSLSDGDDQPTMLLCGMATWYEYYKAVEAKAQLTTALGKEMANYGFQTLEFMGKPVVADPNCPEGIMYFINEKYLKWRVHSKADFASTDWRPDDTRLAKKQEILLTGNLTLNNSRKFGKLVDIKYTAL